jgi:hypothetical protein
LLKEVLQWYFSCEYLYFSQINPLLLSLAHSPQLFLTAFSTFHHPSLRGSFKKEENSINKAFESFETKNPLLLLQE